MDGNLISRLESAVTRLKERLAAAAVRQDRRSWRILSDFVYRVTSVAEKIGGPIFQIKRFTSRERFSLKLVKRQKLDMLGLVELMSSMNVVIAKACALTDGGKAI